MTTPPRDDSPWFTPDLDALEATTWGALARGSLRPKDALHWPSVATVDPNLGPLTRTVVLRRCNRAHRILEFHTDTRSAKFDQLSLDPRLCWLFYDHGKKVQLRARALASLHTDDHVANAVWDMLGTSSRRTYCVSPDPGSEVDAPHGGVPDAWAGAHLTHEQVAHGRENFCVVSTRVLSLEVLYLSRAGHRRARFDYDGHERAAATWLIP